MTVYCRNCGEQIEASAKFCAKCGAAQPSQEQIEAHGAQPQQMQGQPHYQPVQIVTPAPAKAKNKKTVMTVIIILVTAFVLFVGGIAAVVIVAINSVSKQSDTDYYVIQNDEIPSVKSVIGHRRLTGYSNSTINGVRTKKYTYSIGSNQGEDMRLYAKALVDEHGFTASGEYSYYTSGKEYMFSRPSVDTGFKINLQIDFDIYGYIITITKVRM